MGSAHHANCQPHANYFIISLNSNIDMSEGSAQEKWLREDLAAHPALCTLAYWHHPRFSSGERHGDDNVGNIDEDLGPLWEELYKAGAEIVLNGHEHNYERFAPQTPDGQPDSQFGIREFVVGTGGAGLYRIDDPIANSEVRNDTTHGVLKLTLYADRYEWRFVPVAGQSFTPWTNADSDSGTCHGAPPAGARPVRQQRSVASGPPVIIPDGLRENGHTPPMSAGRMWVVSMAEPFAGSEKEDTMSQPLLIQLLPLDLSERVSVATCSSRLRDQFNVGTGSPA
jgi:hypothetical protein